MEKGFIKLGKPNQKGRKGFTIEFEGHHAREMAVLKKEQTPFKFAHYGDEWLSTLKKYSKKPFKATVIAPSAVSLIYKDEISGYSKDQFIKDHGLKLLNELLSTYLDENVKGYSLNKELGELELEVSRSTMLIYLSIN